jgi:hypothetical protein
VPFHADGSRHAVNEGTIDQVIGEARDARWLALQFYWRRRFGTIF